MMAVMDKRAVVPLLALVLAISACAPTRESQPSAAPTTPVVSATPAPTETMPPPVLTPTVAFDGDCTRMLSDAQLDSLLGEGWASYSDKLKEWDVSPVARLESVQTLGGIECRWVAADDGEGGAPQLRLTLLPAEEVPATFESDFSEPRCDPSYDVEFCRLAQTRGEPWVMASVGPTTDEVPVDLLQQAIADAASSFDGAAEAASRQDTWWELPSCDALAGRMRLDEVIGPDFGSGYWEGQEQPEQTLLDQTGVERTCPWFTGDTLPADGEFYIVDVVISSGGAWRWDAISGHGAAQPVEVVGAQDAVLFETGTRSARVFATDGTNVLSAGGASSEAMVDIASRALAALGADGVSSRGSGTR